jgi:hypothetical protein
MMPSRVQENASCETGCASAALEFVQFVHRHFDAEWILKIDDDVYLSPTRLLAATSQWNDISAEYVGCMNHGLPVGQKPKHSQKSKFLFAPGTGGGAGNAKGGSAGILSLVDPYYSMHAAPSAYALSRNVVSRMLRPNSHLLRDISEEGACATYLPISIRYLLQFTVAYFQKMLGEIIVSDFFLLTCLK